MRFRFRFKLRTLLIFTTLAGLVAAYYVSVWSQVDAERRALKQLRQRGFEVYVDHDLISVMPGWRGVRQTIEWPWHALREQDLPLCRGLNLSSPSEQTMANSKAAELTLRGGGSSACLLSDFSQLEFVNFSYPVSEDEISLLACLPYLDTVYLDEAGVGDELVDALLQLPHLKFVHFGERQISMASFERLCDADIEVSHYGIHDRRLEDNYLKYNQLYYQNDSEKSELEVTVSRGTDQDYTCRYRLQLQTVSDRYTEDLSALRLGCDLDGLMASWDELVGKELPLSAKQATMTDHYLDDRGAWLDVERLSYQVIARNENRFRIKSTFELRDEARAESDAWVRIAKVKVFLHKDDSVADGVRAMREAGFNATNFGEPSYEAEYHLLTYPFTTNFSK